jgi:hypothetical protein
MFANGPAMKRWGNKTRHPLKVPSSQSGYFVLTFFLNQISDLAVIAFAATSQTAPNPQCFMSHC